MTLRLVTIAVMMGCLVAVFGVGLYDLLPATRPPADDTISEVTLPWWQRRPIVPLLVGLGAGILLGHLAWPQGCL
jgi:hypothetical protein